MTATIEKLTGREKTRMQMCKSNEIAMAIVRELGVARIEAAIAAGGCPAKFLEHLPSDWRIRDAADALGHQVAPTVVKRDRDPAPEPISFDEQMEDSAATVAQFAIAGEVEAAKEICALLWGEKRTAKILTMATQKLQFAIAAIGSSEM